MSNPARIPVIGIIGGIGSGKSAVANWVAGHAAVSVIDADALGHAALEVETVKQALVKRFGDGILNADGTIGRSALAKLVFGGGPEQVLARQDLERIVHPQIARQIETEVQAAAQAGRQAVLLDAAVLLEAGWQSQCQLVVYIDTSDSIRLKRVLENRGWTEVDLRRRESSQWSLAKKRSAADLTVHNDGDLQQAGQFLLDALRNIGFIRAVS